MRTGKELKVSAKIVLKKHYILLVFLCLITLLFNSESIFSTTPVSSTGTSSETAQETSDLPLISSLLSLDGTAGEVFEDMISSDWTAGQDKANARLESYRTETDDTGKVLGHTQGVLASAVNNLLSGKLIIKIAQSLMSIFKSQNVVSGILIVGSLLLYFGFWVFVINLYEVIISRMFLEARTYDKVPLSHLMHLGSVHKVIKAAWVMLVRYIYSTLWSLTIVGIFTKYYSYRMVPFIIAENPEMKANEAITLSRKMMNGHKWECFKLDLSFIGWYLLDAVTLGVTSFLFLQPYHTAVFAEYYTDLRRISKDSGIPNSDKLNDTYLFEYAPHEVLIENYADTMDTVEKISANKVELTGAKKFFVENLSIWLGDAAEKSKYQKMKSLEYQTVNDRNIIDLKQYPSRLSPLASEKKKQTEASGSVFFLRCYTIRSIILMFFLFSFVGWLWEVSLYLMKSGVFVNRGTMLGPWLPIYGSGGVICLILMSRFREKPVAAFLGSCLLCAILEYSSSWFLQANYGQRWWDYTGYFLNLNGRICAEGILVFGIGCMIVIYLIAPLNDLIFAHINQKVLLSIALVLLTIFGIDAVHSINHPNSGAGITDDHPTACISETFHL